ncbi:hypothetical protein JWG44_14950 [Leptospira sp. 201903071]|uniref:LA_2272/LA_2273 family lipoprotein n=1 Tax=Leptospira ainazelensis TaxID=2810034 RepID=UPI0019622E4A|nr:hypothetical protein [Leptospira ainazelensis]MBM9501549.1 hypothetical protein [Leptospira ainazelensis]
MQRSSQFSILLVSFCWILFYNCGIALTPRLTAKIPPKTGTEVFRLNLLSGEVSHLYGINLGGLNSVDHLIGTQIGIVNVAENSIGIQAGLLNNSNPTYGTLKIGLFNFNFFLDRGMPRPGPYEDYDQEQEQEQENKNRDQKNFGLSIGVANVMSGKFNFGLFNWAEGLNVGFVNLNEGSSVNLGIVNIGSNAEVPPEKKRAISFGIFNLGSKKEEFQIGIVNYCPNKTIPIMIIANYCSKPVTAVEEKTEVKPIQ